MELKRLLLDPNAGDILRAMHKSGALAEFLPALAELDINDARSHRHKNNFFHSIQVFEQARTFGDPQDLVLLTAALLHDIGKKATRAFDEKGEPTFTSHEHVGARMIRKVLKPHGYSNSELSQIEELIENHMRSYGFKEELWTDSAIRRFQAELSTAEQLSRLLVLFKSDVTSKNNPFKNKVIKNMDALARRISEVSAADALKLRRPAVDGNELMELFDLKPGRELGALMKFLNSEEGLVLSREQALEAVRAML